MALVAQIAPDAGPFLIKWRAKLQQNGIAHEEILARTDDKVDLAPRGSVHFPAVDWSDWLETAVYGPGQRLRTRQHSRLSTLTGAAACHCKRTGALLYGRSTVQSLEDPALRPIFCKRESNAVEQ